MKPPWWNERMTPEACAMIVTVAHLGLPHWSNMAAASPELNAYEAALQIVRVLRGRDDVLAYSRDTSEPSAYRCNICDQRTLHVDGVMTHVTAHVAEVEEVWHHGG